MPWDGGTDFIAGTKAFASLFNDRFAELAAYTDGIPAEDLEDGSPGQLIVCDGGGEPTLRTLSGEATLSSGGALELKPKTRFHTQTANIPILSPYVGLVPGLQTAALDAGAWFVFGKMEIEQASGASSRGAQFQLEKSAASGIGIFKITAEANGTGLGMTIGLLTSGGGDFARLTYMGGGDSLSATGLRGVLLAWKAS